MANTSLPPAVSRAVSQALAWALASHLDTPTSDQRTVEPAGCPDIRIHTRRQGRDIRVSIVTRRTIDSRYVPLVELSGARALLGNSFDAGTYCANGVVEKWSKFIVWAA